MQIHELNDFNGALGAGAYLAIDGGNDTGKISTTKLLKDVNDEIGELDTTLNARIDNIIAGGTAPSAAEVTDARLGANGVTYASLGEAIRSQISNVTNDLIINRALSFAEEGKYISWANGNSSALASANYVEMNVEGAKYVNYYYTMAPDLRGLAFYDAANRYISGVQVSTSEQLLISVPQNASICRATVKRLDQFAVITDIDSVLDTQIKTNRYANFMRIEEVELTLNSGKYVTSSGGLNDLAGAVYSDPILIKANQRITFRGIGSNGVVGLISTSNDGVTLPYKVEVIDNNTYTAETVSYLALQDCYVIVSSIDASPCEAWIYYDLDQIDTNLNNILITYSDEITTGKYVAYTSGRIDSFPSLNYVTVYVKGAEYINYDYYSQFSDQRGLAFYDSGDNYISGVQATNQPQKKIAVPQNAVICRATVISQTQLSVITSSAYILRGLSNVDNSISGPDILSAFQNITCLGDSLTESLVYTGAAQPRLAYKPYPTILGVKTGATIESLARGGYSASQCWNAFNGNIVSKTGQLFIIYLGTNDGLTDTLATDAPTSIPYQNWADTNTGCYAKLIAKAQDVGGRVLLIKCFATEGDLETTNDVIEQCAARFNCAIVGPIYLADSKYHYYPDLSGSNGVHYNDLGYSAFTDALIDTVGALDTNVMKYIIPE